MTNLTATTSAADLDTWFDAHVSVPAASPCDHPMIGWTQDVDYAQFRTVWTNNLGLSVSTPHFNRTRAEIALGDLLARGHADAAIVAA